MAEDARTTRHVEMIEAMKRVRALAATLRERLTSVDVPYEVECVRIGAAAMPAEMATPVATLTFVQLQAVLTLIERRQGEGS
jgi:hypothetical protein